MLGEEGINAKMGASGRRDALHERKPPLQKGALKRPKKDDSMKGPGESESSCAENGHWKL